MNPLQKLNARVKATERAARKRKAAAVLFLSFLFVGICISKQARHPKPATAEVADRAQVPASSLLAFASVAEETPLQTVAVYPFAKTFDEQLAKSKVVHSRLSYKPDKKLSRARLVSRPRNFSFVPKPAAVAPTKIKLSSDNWPRMDGYQRWKFVEAYVNSQHWKCPSSGMSTEAEIQKLSSPNITWWMVRSFGLNNCVKRS